MEQLKVGDPCQECLAEGRDNKLRLFYLNLQEDQLLKCEARTCLWPHNDEVSSEEELDFEAPAHPQPPASTHSLPSLLEDLPADPPTTAPWEEAPIPFPDPVSVDDDEFILQLLQQLTPATEESSAESAQEPELNLNSQTDQPPEVKPNLELQLPDLSCLDNNIPEQGSKPQKATIAKAEIPLLPAKLMAPPKLKAQGSQINSKAKQPAPKTQIPARQQQEIPLQPARLMTPPRNNSLGDPFSTPPKKASTQPRSPAAAAQPAFNIIISIPEINPAKSFLDAVNRHSAAAKPAARGGGRGTQRPATGRRPRTQAVKQMIEKLETTADAKRTS